MIRVSHTGGNLVTGRVGKSGNLGTRFLVPGPFSAQIRKVEARLGKLAKIRKVEIN